MPTQKQKTEIPTNDLLAKAKPADNPDLYANHIQVSISANELFIDFYYISPVVGNATKPIAKHIQRTISPIGMAKGLASALVNIVAIHEAEHNVTLPSTRDPDPNDKINLWP